MTMRGRHGFSLIELMITCALMSTIFVLFVSATFNLRDTTGAIEGRGAATEGARAAMYSLSRELGQASAASLTPLPGGGIGYRIIEDLDGDGTALDASGNVELGTVRTIQLDANDANRDGIREAQLVLLSDGNVRVIANNLAGGEDANANGNLDPGEDLDGDGQIDEGLMLQIEEGGVRIHLATKVRGIGPGAAAIAFTEFVGARNP